MKWPWALLLGSAVGAAAGEPAPSPAPPNEVAGTWRMVAATLEAEGRTLKPYGDNPQGMLVFTTDLHFVEVLTDGDTPPFASNARGGGTDEENRRAMASSIAFFGTYTVDAQGRFAGNRVEGATFPNWVGAVRTARELTLRVEGDRMYETFVRPDGGRVVAQFVRVRGRACAPGTGQGSGAGPCDGDGGVKATGLPAPSR
ncbi:lipocalin-like domain-containing protein [Stenotrophomonas sp. HITSZ_GD]|uniref:lipocalin-like domain-containing protein n=1 Tax=Stenotrophomonas sp. HITSZ_GD TaxID=3037248 RepID=UPI00240E2140|nr:lipocalin-like domain-containing protein [Stenotrophomonas sp. HITSZ_GD]MDG2524247.1 lipocalin-like domain-containing protein [Stenotrophomonas sp. HITSZ_GD]